MAAEMRRANSAARKYAGCSQRARRHDHERRIDLQIARIDAHHTPAFDAHAAHRRLRIDLGTRGDRIAQIRDRRALLLPIGATERAIATSRLIAIGIAVINIDPPIVMFCLFVLYGLSGYLLYFWRKSKGIPTSVISTSTDEPEERGLHK